MSRYSIFAISLGSTHLVSRFFLGILSGGDGISKAFSFLMSPRRVASIEAGSSLSGIDQIFALLPAETYGSEPRSRGRQGRNPR
jgi:hypothetical protein